MTLFLLSSKSTKSQKPCSRTLPTSHASPKCGAGAAGSGFIVSLSYSSTIWDRDSFCLCREALSYTFSAQLTLQPLLWPPASGRYNLTAFCLSCPHVFCLGASLTPQCKAPWKGSASHTWKNRDMAPRDTLAQGDREAYG